MVRYVGLAGSWDHEVRRMLRKLPARIRRAVILGISLLIGVAAPSSVAFPGILNVEAAPFASPSTSYVSGITVQNLSSNSNPVTIQFFDSSGNLVSAATINVTLSPLAQQTWYTPTQTSLPAGFAG